MAAGNGSSLGGPEGTPTPHRQLLRELQTKFVMAISGANLFGAVLVFLFLNFVVPLPENVRTDSDLGRLNIIVFVLYMLVAMPVGVLWGVASARPIRRWLSEERPPTAAEREHTLNYPLLGFRRMGPLWLGAAVLFGVLNGFQSVGSGLLIGVTIALGGLATATLIVLWTERAIRDVTALALETGAPVRPVGPGVGARVMLSWGIASGIPLVGLVLVSLAVLFGADVSAERLAATALFLGAIGLGVGLMTVQLAGRSIADPVQEVQSAIREVEQGNFDANVRVADGNEVGLLAAGFNRMVAGLRERERLRDAFGTFVDPSLAERVLEEGTDLAGEDVDASVLFMDIRGFTSFAERAEAKEVVGRLNDLFERVVPIIARHGGHANKFLGDGLMAVFGAPERQSDHAERAVRAAREIAEMVRDRYGDDLRVGIGVNSGRVVVGTVGGGGRLDFTVIGDVVNTAARVESATRETGDDVLITEATLKALGQDGDFQERPPVPLKGKSEPVRLFAPTRLDDELHQERVVPA